MFFSKTRTKEFEAQKFLAQVANQWSMDRARRLEERRTEQRAPGNVGVWVIPMDEAAPEISQAFVALTKDLSSNGLSVICNRSVDTPEYLVGFSGEPEARFLRAKLLSRKDLGLGWLQLCMQVIEMVDKETYPQLMQFSGSPDVLMFREESASHPIGNRDPAVSASDNGAAGPAHSSPMRPYFFTAACVLAIIAVPAILLILIRASQPVNQNSQPHVTQ